MSLGCATAFTNSFENNTRPLVAINNTLRIIFTTSQLHTSHFTPLLSHLITAALAITLAPLDLTITPNQANQN